MKAVEPLLFDVFNVKHRFFLVLTLEMNEVGSCIIPESSVLVESTCCIPVCMDPKRRVQVPENKITQRSGESNLLG